MERRQERRRGAAEIEVVGVQVSLVGRGPVVQQPAGVGRQLEHAVAPAGAPVERPVPGRDEDPAAAGLDDRPRPAPDGIVAVGVGHAARAGGDQPVAIGALGVPDVDDPAAGAVDRDHVAVIGRDVADVAAGDRHHPAAGHLQRRGDLFVPGVECDPARPHLMARGQRQLVDDAVGTGAVDEPPVGVRRRRRGGHLRVARGGVDAGRAELPQPAAGARVDGDRLAVARGDDEHVAPGAMHRDAAERNGGGVGDAVDVDLAQPQPSRRGGRDPGVCRAGAAALGVVTELEPVGGRLGVHRGRGGARRSCARRWRRSRRSPRVRRRPRRRVRSPRGGRARIQLASRPAVAGLAHRRGSPVGGGV